MHDERAGNTHRHLYCTNHVFAVFPDHRIDTDGIGTEAPEIGTRYLLDICPPDAYSFGRRKFLLKGI